MGPASDLHVTSTHLLDHAPAAMSTVDSVTYHSLSHIGEMVMQDHSPQLLPDLWPVDEASSSSHVSTSSSPSMDNEVPATKSSATVATTSNSSRKRSSTPASTSDDRAEKRRRNNLAAAKYRQKKVDRIEELEGKLQAVVAERDELKIALAKRDAEVELLRRMLESKR